MAERYTRLFSLTENLYQSGAPLLIAAGALLKDNQSNKTLAQIKLQSLSDKPIKAAKISITPLDVVGNKLGETIEHQYLDLNIQRDEAFGAKSPIALPDATTRAFRAAVTSVVFADNTVWSASDAAWEPLPAPVMLDEVYPDAELRKQFMLKFGSRSQYAYAEFADLCRCPCGALNRRDEAECHSCGCDILALRALDVSELERRKDERLAQERITEEKAAVEAAERTKKEEKTTTIIGTVLFAIAILLTILIPGKKYNRAADLRDEGKYTEAYEAFETLGNYKDSSEQALSIYALSEREIIQTAQVGDHVFFGAYEQDNDTSNGQEKIEWLVFSIEDEKMLLLSRYAIDRIDCSIGEGYEKSSLREWLNGDFLSTAFTNEEQALIAVSNSDKVHLLDGHDVIFHFPANANKEIWCEPTAYAVANGVKVRSDGGCEWTLRPGMTEDGDPTDARAPGYPDNLNIYDETTSSGGAAVDNISAVIRPAIWVDLNG